MIHIVQEGVIDLKTPNGFANISNNIAFFNPNSNEIVVIGRVDEDDETHNCDHMGCSCVQHVVFRGKLSSWNYSPPAKREAPYVYQPNDN